MLAWQGIIRQWSQQTRDQAVECESHSGGPTRVKDDAQQHVITQLTREILLKTRRWSKIGLLSLSLCEIFPFFFFFFFWGFFEKKKNEHDPVRNGWSSSLYFYLFTCWPYYVSTYWSCLIPLFYLMASFFLNWCMNWVYGCCSLPILPKIWPR